MNFSGGGSQSQSQAEGLKNSYVSQITSQFKPQKKVQGDGTQTAQAADIPKSKYAGSSTGTIYGANVDTAGKKSRDLGTPGLEQVGTQTKKSVGRNPFAS